ncbi:hypothetical protein MYAM1_003489 [Malassezia yamatoensis]|uniref:ENTH domain-containing protein n=1 Tax=Malassezia yamatoensis TaxID=253288 RepID=A0AAJ6CKH7_9BASI|nr:hypothetical protein MYAM1_003489 [Malassezia yamatoensis]
MSQYDKLVKGATKPKQDLPKAKYMEPILASAVSKTGALQDVFRSLSYRLQDPNSTVVFKTLLVVHTLLRSSSSVTVLSYLAGDPSALRLKLVATGGLHEYTYSQTLTKYASYLEARIITFKELGYDLVQASKRDQFARLRKVSVSKGLLREMSVLQKLLNALLECAFFAECRQDELTMSALRMTLKDLLAHYMGMNEGIINMLQHYFDMGRQDAQRSLDIYRKFCWQTEKVVAFLDSSSRSSPSLRSAIPSLNHAPLSLAGALEEYLNDPNFEQNRKKQLSDQSREASAKSTSKERTTSSTASNSQSAPDSTNSRTQSETKPVSDRKLNTNSSDSNRKALQDFFEALEQPNTTTPFNATYASYAGFNAQPDWYQSQTHAFGIGAQPTGFNPFAPMPTGAYPMPAQPTGAIAMQPQATGFNPFQPTPAAGQNRMPMPAPLMPQHTMATSPFDQAFGQLSVSGSSNQAPTGSGVNAQGSSLMPSQTQAGTAQPYMSSAAIPMQQKQTMPLFPTPSTKLSHPSSGNEKPPWMSADPTNAAHPSSSAEPNRKRVSFGDSAATRTPAKGSNVKSTSLKPQKTGTMNPFSIPSDFEEPEPVVQKPKQSTLNELAMQSWLGTQQVTQEPQQMESPSSPFAQRMQSQPTGLMSSLASEFARPNQTESQAASKSNLTSNPSWGDVPAASHQDRLAGVGSMQFQPNSSTSSKPLSSRPFPTTQSSVDSNGLTPWQSRQPSMPTGVSQQPMQTSGLDNPYGLGTLGSASQQPSQLNLQSAQQENNDRGNTNGKTSNLPSFATGLGSGSSSSTWNTNFMRPDATGLGISSNRDASSSYNSQHMNLSPHATGSPMPFSSPGAASASFPNPHQWGGSMGGGPALAGIKPFQPTSSFGHNLFKNQFGSPDISETKEPPTHDLLQF